MLVVTNIHFYRKSKDSLEKYSQKLQDLIENKSNLSDEIKNSNKDIRQLNKDINKFYDQMYEYHKLVISKENQNKLSKIYEKHK